MTQFVEETVQAALPGGPLAYTLRRSVRARHVRVVVDPRQGAIVTVPGGRRLGAAAGHRLAEDFVRDREAWIRRHLERQAHQRAVHEARGPLGPGATIRYAGQEHVLAVVPAVPGRRRATVLLDAGGSVLVVRPAERDPRPLERILEDWCRDRARAAIDAAIASHASALRVQPTAVTVRDPRSRWGSASRTGRLSFSWRLVLAPPEALETVVVHELAHLRVFGHGPRFWALVASRRSDHRAWRRWLHVHSIELHEVFREPAGAAA